MSEPQEPQHFVPLVPVGPEPAPVQTEPVQPVRKPSPFVRVGIVTGTAALVLVGAVAAMGASPAPSGSTTTPNAPSASGDPNAGGTGPGRWGGFGMMGGKGDMHDMDFGGAGRGSRAITITSIAGSDLSLKTDDGWTRTIAVTSSTTITKAGATITASDLAVGDEIRFAETKATDGTYSITRIVVVVPHLGGEVTAKTSDTITVTRRDGTTATIHVGSSTTFTVRGVTTATLADVAVGMRLQAEGTLNSDGSLDASRVMAGAGGHDGPGFGPGFGPGHGWDDGTNPGASPNPSATPG